MGSERTDRSRALVAATAAAALFCIVLTLLAQQLRAGRDPAIGARKLTAPAAPRQVIVRRIIVTRVIDDAARARAASQPAATQSAPAPAPAPAPVVSRGS
jgi:hypothetical protein